MHSNQRQIGFKWIFSFINTSARLMIHFQNESSHSDLIFKNFCFYNYFYNNHSVKHFHLFIECWIFFSLVAGFATVHGLYDVWKHNIYIPLTISLCYVQIWNAKGEENWKCWHLLRSFQREKRRNWKIRGNFGGLKTLILKTFAIFDTLPSKTLLTRANFPFRTVIDRFYSRCFSMDNVAFTDFIAI